MSNYELYLERVREDAVYRASVERRMRMWSACGMAAGIALVVYIHVMMLIG